VHSFGLPGHRFGEKVDQHAVEVLGRSSYAADVKMAKSAVPQAERLYAAAVGARDAIFTTCGSSISVHTAILSLVGPGDRVLVDRNVHKSVVAGLIQAGAEPVWLRPSWDHENEIAHPASREAVEQALRNEPDIRAVIMITPTEYGTGADVSGIAAAVHAQGIPLMVDEAWGCHFGFHPSPPTAAVVAGADVAVQSLHKAGGGLCQASVILVGGDLIETTDLRLRLDLLTTTSPSALVYGSIDGWRRHAVQHGRELIDGALARADHARRRLGAIDGFSVLDDSIHSREGVAEWDPLKLSVDVSGLGMTGYQVRDWLLEECAIACQLADARRVLMSITYADQDRDIGALVSALERLASDPLQLANPAPMIPPLEELDLEQVLSPREAFFSATEQVRDPVGRIAAEMVSPYPPGVPAVLPGERWNAATAEYLRAGKAAGMTIPDAGDPTLDTFRVVRQR
jgi:arginine/lysine/ornithine decarboxylase